MTLTSDELIEIRRHLHMIPELAMDEHQTHDYLKQVIASFPQTNLEIKELPELPTALLVLVKGVNPQRNIGYRCDMDALPVDEMNGLSYASKHPHVMHACGHDIHMTVALGILNYFSINQPKDNLVFFFQPAEESKSGGKVAYDLGAFSGQFKVDEFYGLHDNPQLKSGVIGCCNGTLFAGTTEVNIIITGKSGHAAYPHLANDAIVIAANFINQVQTVISRSIDPTKCGVITFGKLQAGVIRNVIAGQARLEGTIRGLTQEMIEFIRQRITEIASGLQKSFNCQITVEYNQGGYFPVENDPTLTKNFIEYMQRQSSVDFVETKPKMTGEDFGYLLNKIPGTMFWLGVESSGALHSHDFLPKENAIKKGADAIVGFLNYRMNMGEK
ncbi:m20 m25 m40 family peptidase [Companilactobacillus paralimentarius DSM 13238 = JCM 10415]|jgi:amidohydrolase|uniref:N-acetyldiaminopimelate deacetylase n=1 Tax=Companilactobacillus paralimentarius DSM 13238 = JCM 10415 TaxID=1122151 RepID=A0A0R1PA36_9LACO|nr:N-acetyldiaminopimelate deacetylase [Companilactobacillus paralimentarius]KAE9565483.1 N-acetyldiaminopimelate deacetylase [Companilactobacillus paralimentarius]KRL29376.1 m20 m25 m40 family peptidase [Companilactobacillus paralimentarius DSM 13238 = JCM 10415]QFR68670.1 amidohydrolase [Companilactobacillus paralimentarius]